mmetsp:Transcript_8459/g.9389  ORF Transcript_8459/g.9389 Transcript_8459/m.9389 type:complete len:480 (+) Transcript_8459:29-1468(+)
MMTILQEHLDKRRRPIPDVVLSHPTFSFLKDPKDLEKFSLHESFYGDLTLRALIDLEPDSILFRIPFNCTLTYDEVTNTKLSQLVVDSGVTCSPEVLVWLNMICWCKIDYENNVIATYLRSLAEIPPNVSSWPSHLQDLLVGTNLYSVLDVSGENDNTLGNVQVIQKVLCTVEKIRQFLIANEMKYKHNNGEDDGDSSKSIRNLFIPEVSSIFTLKSIAWARGHFVSRRFPELKTSSKSNIHTQQQYTIGYGDALSCFIPILDLMNHNQDISSTCTVALEGTDMVVVRIGTKGVKGGDELFYKYGNLSNESLLHGYGFCLEDNDQDAISFRICKQQQSIDDNNNNNKNNNTADGGEQFFLKRGGLSEVSKEFWEAIAVDDGGTNGDQLEIGFGDLKMLKEYVDKKLKDLLLAPGWCDYNTGETTTIREDIAGTILLDEVRKKFIQTYLKGQKEILQQLQDDLFKMLLQCSDLDDVKEDE